MLYFWSWGAHLKRERKGIIFYSLTLSFTCGTTIDMLRRHAPHAYVSSSSPVVLSTALRHQFHAGYKTDMTAKWACEKCQTVNHISIDKCYRCFGPPPKGTNFHARAWDCPYCSFKGNKMQARTCRGCRRPQPPQSSAAAPKKAPPTTSAGATANK